MMRTSTAQRGYEKQTTGNNTFEIYYINAPTGLCAMYVVANGIVTMYYVYKDHLGSILKLTDAGGNTVAEQNFDAWGRNRNPDDWTYNNIPVVPAWLYRGFTGHEHLPQFALVNMNGRMYDPVLGMMLSPDNYIQDLSSTQSYNRYIYCSNNPLKFTDPTGYSFLSFLASFGKEIIKGCVVIASVAYLVAFTLAANAAFPGFGFMFIVPAAAVLVQFDGMVFKLVDGW